MSAFVEINTDSRYYIRRESTSAFCTKVHQVTLLYLALLGTKKWQILPHFTPIRQGASFSRFIFAYFAPKCFVW